MSLRLREWVKVEVTGVAGIVGTAGGLEPMGPDSSATGGATVHPDRGVQDTVGGIETPNHGVLVTARGVETPDHGVPVTAGGVEDTGHWDPDGAGVGTDL